MRRISIVVEGDGDQGAMPILVRAQLQRRQIYDIQVGKPLNGKGRGKLLRDGQLERFAQLAALQAGTGAVLVTPTRTMIKYASSVRR